MAITTNVNGTLKTLTNVYTNVGGSIKELTVITSNVGGTLKTIHNRTILPTSLTWTARNYAIIRSNTDNGKTIKVQNNGSGSGLNRVMLGGVDSGQIYLYKGTVVTLNFSDEGYQGYDKYIVDANLTHATDKTIHLTESGRKKGDGSYGIITFTVPTTGYYILSFYAYHVTGSQSGVYMSGITGTATISFII